MKRATYIAHVPPFHTVLYVPFCEEHAECTAIPMKLFGLIFHRLEETTI
jgi:hypothetical protein